MDCIFCKLANGEIPTNTVYEDDNFRVILDAAPANPGHCLILPKTHAADIFELPVYTMSAAKEGGAYGAVLVAGVGAGIWKNLNEAIRVLKEDEKFYTPNPETIPAYRKAYEKYKLLYTANKQIFDME